MSPWTAVLEAARPERIGEVSQVRGLSVQVRGLDGAVGDVVTLDGIDAEVVATGEDGLRCMPLASVAGLTVGAPVRGRGGPVRVPTGSALLGRVLDGLGRPIDGKGPLAAPHVSLDHDTPSIMERDRIDTALPLGVRALDTLVSVGRGQRVGLFAGSGVGKSSLLSMIARGTEAEVTVIALVGERGREVREFIEDDLGPEGLARSVVIVSTSDQPAMARIRAAFTATRIAEAFRDEGAHAILMMDSLTRVAMAQREIGLSAGEPPATRGYPPSTFSLLAGLLERAGTDRAGSITGIYTVLVDGDDHNEPIADTVRSILDGHVVLDRALALAGHHPAIDVLGSVSRVAGKITSPERRAQAATLRAVLAARRRANDLIDIGAYHAGADARIDAAIAHERAISAFLTQPLDETSAIEESWARLDGLVSAFEGVS
ncbi:MULTISPECIES: FliI/YscN family ATPase [unclassified Microbacterium]|uniref:FliI/YscN family ATPase n=2 Tax=Microbacterium TaxID=33882 RepID=UPI002468F6D3|nr:MULTISPECIES: FliI/YscN family ATPase [unclassified Microbacterium]MDH5138625.1 FliI/YscN family ATPase [Microbacterium sp. RD11]MDH5147054.1 FliI/YscN family ATPase [Microbacterium sp. RD12]MDH5156690.1 FliI/YscN family ATPase [Microbacterium sp. RD06]MDH5168173.1 FliI/YscN family ATPase [Microbacterium sp. RD02]